MTPYNAQFFVDNKPGAVASAEVVLPWVLEQTGALAVVDVGCAQGAWLSVAKSYGCRVHGFDGFAPADQLLISEWEFVRQDLAKGVDCSRWDLAICLEVAEHLPPEAAEVLVAGLCQARWVLWSAATPGQPGVGHINCQPHEYWADLFAGHGMVGSSEVRDRVADDERVESFYRRNMVLYGREQSR